MRFYILRALFLKECHRHVANRGGLALGLLLIAATILLTVFNPMGGGEGSGDATSSGIVGGIHHCYIEYPKEDKQYMSTLLDHLDANTPKEMKPSIKYRALRPENIESTINYSPGVGSIRLKLVVGNNGRKTLEVRIWHPPGEPEAMAIYENWFFREARYAFQAIAEKDIVAAGGAALPSSPVSTVTDDLWAIRESFGRLERDAEAARVALGAKAPPNAFVPAIFIERQGLGGKVLDFRSAIATGLVVFALYFTCVYLLPTLNCEERERGVLLAQALSPASPAEILAAKFLFYPLMGCGLAATIAGIYKVSVLSTLFFWLSLGAVAAGFLGIGMTVATLAKTQRAAFLGAMCYLLSVSLVLIICSTNGIPFIPYLALEFHIPRILHASLSNSVKSEHWIHLIAALGLATCWITIAGYLFRKRGWQ